MTIEATNYEPVNGDQISGSPSLLARYISSILGKGGHFQYIDGDTIEVIVAGQGEQIANAFGDVNVAAKIEAPGLVDAPVIVEVPEPEAVATEAVENIEIAVTEAVHEAVAAAVEVVEVLSPAEDLAAVEEPVIEKAPVKRGRKPAAKPEVVEGE